MNQLEKQFKEATQNIRLTKDEKSLMREHLLEYMAYKPIRERVQKEHASLRFSPFTFFRAHHLSGALIIALTVTSSSFGVSLAADDALPGDLLYGVKVNINEELKTALISDGDTETLLAWEQERAERRLLEAGQLAAEGRLDNEKREQVAKLFAEHTGAIVEQALAVEKSDPVLAAETSGMLEDTLETHEAMLARIIVEKEGEEDESARELVSQVRTVAMEAGKIREEAEEKIENEEVIVLADESEKSAVENDTDKANSPNMRERATYRSKNRAYELLGSVEGLLEKIGPDSDLYTQANAQITYGKEVLGKGEEALTRYDLGEAYDAFKESSAAFQKVSQLLEVAHLFSFEIYPDMQSEPENVDGEGEASTTAEVKEGDVVQGVGVDEKRKEAEERIEDARSVLLTQIGNDERDVEYVNKRIKDAAALVLRGEIAQKLGSTDDASALYKKAFEIADEIVGTLEKVKEENEDVLDLEPKDATTTPNQTEDKKEIVLEHEYVGNSHVFRGVLQTPTPCYTVSGEGVVRESYPEQMTLSITTKAPLDEVVCAQVIDEKEFEFTVPASEMGEVVGVFVDGNEYYWELVPPKTEEEKIKNLDTPITTQSFGGTGVSFDRAFETTKAYFAQ